MSSDIATSSTEFWQPLACLKRAPHAQSCCLSQNCLDLIESYYNDATVNGLHFDRDAEERATRRSRPTY